MIIIGLDPGKEGAMAIMEGSTVLFCESFPIVGDEIDIGAISRDILAHRAGKPCLAVLEKVHSMPKQGVAATFTFGRNVGELRGMLKTLSIAFTEVPPETWKKAVLAGTDWKGNKAASCSYVLRQHPEVNLTPGKKRKPHDGMADAVCLAEFACTGKYLTMTHPEEVRDNKRYQQIARKK